MFIEFDYERVLKSLHWKDSCFSCLVYGVGFAGEFITICVLMSNGPKSNDVPLLLSSNAVSNASFAYCRATGGKPKREGCPQSFSFSRPQLPITDPSPPNIPSDLGNHLSCSIHDCSRSAMERIYSMIVFHLSKISSAVDCLWLEISNTECRMLYMGPVNMSRLQVEGEYGRETWLDHSIYS